LDQQLRLSGMGFVEKLTPNITQPRFTDASHHMGTTRMSHDPKRGVVNSDSRAHGIDNLYVIGSSVFPTVGCGNPTLTIVALALRLADFLKLKK
jgi:choline dehydrogenase-like flavoprotein